jgi:hypothetical protein
MKTYTIDNENSITAHATKQDAGEGESFSSQQELASLVGEWPADRLVEVWSSIPGVAPVKKFKNQKAAVSKIWAAIQGLGGGAGETPAPTNTDATAAQKPAKAAKNAAKGKGTKAAKAKPATKPPAKPAKGRKPAAKVAPAREGSKKATVLGLLQRKGGATLKEIMKATGWQKHSVRGFISGALGKKMGLTVDSVRREDGERVYSIG